MELPILANLTPVGFEGNPPVLSPDFSSEEFNSLLLNQMIDMEVGFCNEDECQGESLFALSEETFFPRSEEKESLSYNTFNELIEQNLIHPLSVPVLPEGQELPPLLNQFLDIPSFKSSPSHLPNLIGEDGQRALTSLNQATVTSEKGGPDLTLKLELIDKPQISGLSPDSENDNHRLASLKNNPSLSESCSIQNGAGPESKIKHFMPEEVPKGQNGFFPKAESFEIYHQVGRKMAWSVQNGEERVKLTLDPPRLGNLYMEVIKEKEMVRATLWAESPVTKELLEAHRVELRRILEEDGFKLERFDVFVQQEKDRFMERREFFFLKGQREGREVKEDRAFLSSESSDVPSTPIRRYSGVSSYIDRVI